MDEEMSTTRRIMSGPQGIGDTGTGMTRNMLADVSTGTKGGEKLGSIMMKTVPVANKM